MVSVKNSGTNRYMFALLIIAAVFLTACGMTQETVQLEKEVQTVQTALPDPQIIPEGASCGKCGMYPAHYPKWQSQIVFTDGSMTPFDGCKCMFNFLASIENYDKQHSADDVAVAWVRDFDNSSWLNARDAFFVVGSSIMGPMGKELIPFKEQDAATDFQKKNGGSLMQFADINKEVLKPLSMGHMKMKGHEGDMPMMKQ